MELTKAITELIKTLIWPCLVLFLALWYQGDFLTILKTREVKVGAGGIEFGKLLETIKTTKDGADQALQRLASAPPQDQPKLSADLRRNLNQDLTRLEGQLSVVATPGSATATTQPAPSLAEAQEPGTSAVDRERQGFRALAVRNFDAALTAFDSSFALFPTLHNVKEIRDLLNEHSTELKAGDDRAWKELYDEILKKYSWGMPAEVRKQFQAAVKA